MTMRANSKSRRSARKIAAVAPATMLLAMAASGPALAMSQLTDRSYTTDFDQVTIDGGSPADTNNWRMSGNFDAEITTDFVSDNTAPAWDGTSAQDLDFSQEQALMFRPADLSAGKSVTLTTTVDRLQSDWTANGSNYTRFGFVLVGQDGKPSRVTGDPIFAAQTNNGAEGNPVCVDGTYVEGQFLGPDHTCANPLDGAGQAAVREGGRLQYSVTVNHDGSWSGSVVPLDSDGVPVEAFVGVSPAWSFSGQLSDPDANYMPFLTVKGGSGSKTLTVAGTSFERPVPNDSKLRISNAATSGSFADQLFSPTLRTAAHEGMADNRFDASFVIEPSEYQEGLTVTVSPDNGQGGRNGFMRITHAAGGMNVEIQGASIDDDGNVSWETVDVASNLSVEESHRVNMQAVKFPGARNDIFRAWIGDESPSARVVAQTPTFEAYYEATGQENYASDTLLFRLSGPAAANTQGKGLLIDDLSFSIATEVEPAAEGEGPDPEVLPELDAEAPMPDGDAEGEQGDDEDGLPHTGAGGVAAALLGASLLGAGGGLAVMSRRRA